MQKQSIHRLCMGAFDGVAGRRVLATCYEHCRLSSPRLVQPNVLETVSTDGVARGVKSRARPLWYFGSLRARSECEADTPPIVFRFPCSSGWRCRHLPPPLLPPPFLVRPTSHVPECGSRIAAWNTHGFLGAASSIQIRRRQTFAEVFKKKKKRATTISFVGRERTVARNFWPPWTESTLSGYSSDRSLTNNHTAGGCIIMVRKNFTTHGTVVQHESLSDGSESARQLPR